MSPKEKVEEILRLQDEALASVERAKELMGKADELAAELNVLYCQSFVCDGKAYELVHRAIGFMPGNRYWLTPNTKVKFIG